MHYPKRFLLTFRNSVYSAREPYGIVLHGSEGSVRFNRQTLEVWYDRERNRNVPALQMNDIDGTPYHVLDFLNCVRTRKQPRSDVRSAVRSADVGHRTNAAIRSMEVSKA